MIKSNELSSMAIKGSFWRFSSVVIQAVTNLLTLAILARLLSPTEFGIVAAVQIITGIASIFSDLGIASALIQRKNLTQLHIKVGFSVTILLGIVCFSLIVIFSPFIANITSPSLNLGIIIGSSIAFPLVSIGTVSEALLIRDFNFKRLFWADMSSFIFGFSLVSISMAYFGFGSWSLVGGTLAQALIKSAILLFSYPFPIVPFFAQKEFKELFSFGGAYSILRIVNYFSLKADNFLVGRLAGTYSLGIYDRAFQIMSLPGQYLGNVIDNVMFSTMSKIQEENSRLYQIYLRSISLVNFLLTPLSVFFIAVTPEIVNILLGDKWIQIVLPLQILFCGVPFRISVRMCDSLARAKGCLKENTNRKLIYLTFVIIGTILGLPIGLVGVAIGVNIAIMVHYIVMIQLGLRITSGKLIDILKIQMNGFILSVIVSILSFSLVFILRTTPQYSLWILIEVIIANIIAITGLIILIPKLMDENMIWFLDKLFAAMPINFVTKVLHKQYLLYKRP